MATKTKQALFVAAVLLAASLLANFNFARQHRTDTLLQAQECLERIITVRDTVIAATIAAEKAAEAVPPRVKVVYQKVYVPAPAVAVQIPFKDTSYVSVPKTDSLSLEDYIQVPKLFEYNDGKAYILGSIQRTGLVIDSMRIPTGVTYGLNIDRGRRSDGLVVTPRLSNPLIDSISPYRIDVDKPKIRVGKNKYNGN